MRKQQTIQYNEYTPAQIIGIVGHCLGRLYKEYETALLYAALVATYTWLIVSKFN